MAPTAKQTASINLYAAIMEEAKLRLNSIDMALGGVTILPHQLVREFCFLQLRMLCELIALGCLTAHGDIEATTKLRNEWSADKIIDRLDSLHPQFYPLPVQQTLLEVPIRHWHLDPVSNGSITKAELLTLNGKSGNTLHRGSMKKLLSPQTPVQTNFPDIANWATKVGLLLNHHQIALTGGRFVICMLRNVNDGNKVQVAIAEPAEPPEFSGSSHSSPR